MSTKLRNIILFILLFFIIFSDFSIETKLIFTKFFNSFKTTNSIEVENFKLLENEQNFFVLFTVNDVQNIDFNKSYVTFSGSKYILSNNPESYSYLLDKNIELSKVKIKKEDIQSNNLIKVQDNKLLPKGYTLSTQIFLYDKQGNLNYNWQIIASEKDTATYWSNRVSYLIQNLVWFFAIFGFFSFKTSFGVVYDTKTKKPIPGVIVRIFKDGSLYTTYITNILGFINLKLNKGKYKVHVSKPGYIFPSSLQPLEYDGEYKNLNYGQEFNVLRNNSQIPVNIPLDSEGSGRIESRFNRVFLGTISTLHNSNLFLLGLVVFTQILWWPTSFDTWIFTLIAIILVTIKYYLYFSGLPKKGTVSFSDNRKAIQVSFQVYESVWNKPVTTFTSDQSGKYELILPKGEYYIKIINPELKLIDADAEGKLLLKGKLLNGNFNPTVDIIVESKSIQSV